MYPQRIISVLILLGLLCTGTAQTFRIAGTVNDRETGEALEYALVMILELSLWATTDDDGRFTIQHVPGGRHTIVVQDMGYEKLTWPVTLTADVATLELRLSPSTLKLDDVTVVAQQKAGQTSTTYTIDRLALDNQQIVNLGEISSLLPGGKTRNTDLTSDDRLTLRSLTSEKGNASFGTAILVDGVRTGNNAAMDETSAASTRTLSTSDIESVDVITGIPSAEYGDLSNGLVKVNLRKGKSPYILECKTSPTTTQYCISKGFDLSHEAGVLNVSAERARSVQDVASPYTAYQRNVLSLRYSNTFRSHTSPLHLTMGLTGNLGGYDSKQDPDNTLDSYIKSDESSLRMNMEAEWLLNRPWLTDLTMRASVSLQNRKREAYQNQSSASSQPCLHTTEDGYHVAGADDRAILLGPTGYWYVRSHNDQRPTDVGLTLKGNWSRRLGQQLLSRLLLGAELASTGNQGRGLYYQDLELAPTWREYRYDQLPWMHNLACYAEERLSQAIGSGQTLILNLGLRHDMTLIRHSAYGTACSLSPRLSGRYSWHSTEAEALLTSLTVHAGWGRSVKLPSFQVLYPQDSYTDLLTFTPGSTAGNRAYYAYYTHVSRALHNDALRWQQTDQTDLGFELQAGRIKVSLTGFYHKTRRPYQLVNVYTPFEYQYTSQAALEALAIPSADRSYSVDRLTGQVTVSGNGQTLALPSVTHRTFTSNRQYINGSDVERYGLEWTLDVPLTHRLKLRLDGNYYHYRGLDETLIAGSPSGVGDYPADASTMPLIGYYRGSSASSASTVSTPTVSNGSVARQCNLNASVTMHIPKVRLVMTLKAESSLLNYKRQLSESAYGSRGILLASAGDVSGSSYTGQADHYVALYPEYYATWQHPEQRLPFAEALAEAAQHDQALYRQLSQLIIRSNTAYYFNPNRLSPYCSLNLLVTKEIGDHVSVSFYANNFLNTMQSIHSSQTGLDLSLFDSGYVPKFYYGLSLKLKL